MTELLDSLRHDLHMKGERIETLEIKLKHHDDLVRDNEYLRSQLKSIEQKFERFTIENNKKLDEQCQQTNESNEQVQSLLDEIERIKRDLVLEEYRKQEAERKLRYYDEKYKIEQINSKKLQHDCNQIKQDLRTIHMKYDALQIEMLAMHKANQIDSSLLPLKNSDEYQWLANEAHEQV
jgi:chromosome segregation ATPase